MEKLDKALYEQTRDYSNDLLHTVYTSGCTAHFHHQSEIFWVKKGTFTARINDTERVMNTGDVCISDSYDVHTYSAPHNSGDRGFVVIISKIFLPDAAAYSDLEFKENFVTGKKARPIAELISYLEHNEKKAGELLLRGLCQSVLGAFYDALPVSKKNENIRNFHMREVLHYIHNSYREYLTLETLSKKFGYNPTHFSRIFNSFIPGGLKEYLNKVRVEQAAILIKNGATIENAASECGFLSIETFYRAFKKCFGKPPKAFFEAYEGKNEKENVKYNPFNPENSCCP